MKMMSIICLILFFYNSNIFATVQQNDYLIYNGIKYYIDENPMEEYFEKFPWKRPFGKLISSGLWRGYVATFEIIQNELWLVDIEVLGNPYEIDGHWDLELISVIKKYFNGRNKVKLNWFNGLIGLFESKYAGENEYYKIIEIIRGEIVSEYNFNNSIYRRYKRYKYEIDFNQNINYFLPNDEISNLLNRYIYYKKYTKKMNELYRRLFIVINSIIIPFIIIRLIKSYKEYKKKKFFEMKM